MAQRSSWCCVWRKDKGRNNKNELQCGRQHQKSQCSSLLLFPHRLICQTSALNLKCYNGICLLHMSELSFTCALCVCMHTQTHTHLCTMQLYWMKHWLHHATWGLPCRDNSCPALSLTVSLSLFLSFCLRKCKRTGEGGKKLLWDREDASHCTINNPVHLYVAKADSSAALLSFLTPYFCDALSLPFNCFFLQSLSLITSHTGKWVTVIGRQSFSSNVILNVWFAPFTTILIPLCCCRLV